MFQNYIQAAINHANYDILDPGGSIYGEIPLCPGVYAKADSFEACRTELIEVLEEWILLRLRKNLDLPEIDNLNLNIIVSVDAAN